MKKINTRKLVESAMLIAIATVLSLFAIVRLPMGGSLTLCSMLPLIVLSHRYGWRWGGICALVYSVLQMLLGLNYVFYGKNFGMVMAIMLLDYIVAYTVIGFSGIFKKILKNDRAALAVGIAATFFGRFLCHFISGVWIWDAMWPNEFGMVSVVYSLVYNGSYMGLELILTEVVAMLIYKPLGKYFRGEDLPTQ